MLVCRFCGNFVARLLGSIGYERCFDCMVSEQDRGATDEGW